MYGTLTLYGLTFQTTSISVNAQTSQSYNPRCRLNDPGLGSSAFARHYLRNHILFSLPRGTKMFQFPRFAPVLLVMSLQLIGFPHSEIFGSILVCKYPKLIAAYHVLLRLLKPRHPPFALAFFFSYDEIAYTIINK